MTNMPQADADTPSPDGAATTPLSQPLQLATTALPLPGERTAAQQKIDSNLLLAIQQRGSATPAQSLDAGIDIDAAGKTAVGIRAEVSADLLRRLTQLGAEIETTDAATRSINARVPLDAIETIASFADVIFIQPKPAATTR